MIKLKPRKVADPALTGAALLGVSGSGEVLVSVDRVIRVWDPVKGKLLRVIDDMDPGARQGIMVWDLSVSGEHLATGVADFTTKVYSTSRGQRLARLSKELKSRFNAAEQVCFSPDEKELACAMGKKIECFAVGDWRKTRELVGHTSKVHLLRYSPDGRRLISAGGKAVKLWDPADGACRATLERHSRLVASLAVAGDASFLASGGEDHQVLLWDLPEGKLRAKYTEHASQVFGLAVSADGRTVASHDFDNALRVWDTRALKTQVCREDVEAERLVFSPDGRLLALPNSSGGQVLDVRDGTLVAELPGCWDVVFSPRGDWLAASGEKELRMWVISGG